AGAGADATVALHVRRDDRSPAFDVAGVLLELGEPGNVVVDLLADAGLVELLERGVRVGHGQTRHERVLSEGGWVLVAPERHARQGPLPQMSGRDCAGASPARGRQAL